MPRRAIMPAVVNDPKCGSRACPRRPEKPFSIFELLLASGAICLPALWQSRRACRSSECGSSSLAPTRFCGAKAHRPWTNALGGCSRSSPSSQLDRPLAQAIRRGASACRNSEECFPSPSPTSCCAFASPLELAGSARTQCRVRTAAIPCHHCRGSHFPYHQLTEGGSDKPRDNFNEVFSPSDTSSRSKSPF
jgi:hypothetical protein